MASRSKDAGQPTFWQELAVQTLRMSGRVGVQLMRLSLSDMKDLLGVALCRELQDRGYRTSDMCVAIGVSRTTVKKYLKLSRELGSTDLQPEALRLAVVRLQDGPVTADKLRRRLPQGDEFDTADVALTLLIDRGLVVKTGEGKTATYALTEQAQTLNDPEWEEPLADLSRLYWLGRDVLRTLAVNSEMAPAKLRKELRVSRNDDRLDRTISFLQELGYVAIASHRPRKYALAHNHVRLIPNEDRAKLRVGLMDLVDKTGVFLENILTRSDDAPIGQRSFEFQARPDDVRAFLKEHRAWVVKRLEAMEATAREEGGGESQMMVWAVCESGKPTA